MVTFRTKNGREVSVSVFDAVFGRGRTIRQKKKAKPKATDAKVEPEAAVAKAGPAEPTPAEAAPAAEATAKPTTADAATDTPVVAAIETPAEAAAEATIEAATVETADVKATAEAQAKETATVNTEDATTTAAAEYNNEWTAEDDQTLMDAKANNRSWKQIAVILPDKNPSRIKERYKTLSKGKGKGTAGGSNEHAGGSKETAEERKANAGGGNNKKEKRGKTTATSRDEGESEWEDAEEEQSRPVIFVEGGISLSYDEMKFLFELHEYFEGIKWLQITSRFWDKVGKRIEPLELRAKLGDRKWSDRTFTITPRDLEGRQMPEAAMPQFARRR